MIKPTAENGSNTNANPFSDPPRSVMGADGGAVALPLKAQLEAAMRQTLALDDAEPQSFLPADELARLVTPDSARRALQACPGCPVMIHSIYASAIFSASRQLLKIFAILVLIDRPAAIQAFMHESISDVDLPLVPSLNGSREDATVVRSNTTPSCFDLARVGFDRSVASAFEEAQWKVLAPSFEPIGAPSAPYMYRFHPKTILPFIWDESAEPLIQTGGHSKVYQASIHPGHHTFNLTKDCDKPHLAIKKLHSTDNEAFEREVDALRRFSNDADPHIINLLVAFKHGDTSYLVFPWADTDLQSFWDTHEASPAKDDHAVLTVKQMLGVAEALKAIHYARAKKRAKAQAQAQAQSLNTAVEEEGYHADLKPENILMVDGQWKLADFGLSQFRRPEEAGKKDRPLGCSPTYRAPEHDVGAFNGQKADIWSLGCVMSVAATWMTLGRKGIRNFRAKRAFAGAGPSPAAPERRRVDDAFFEVSKSQGEKTKLKLKPEVSHWIDKLHETPTASPLIHDLLDLVKNEMLEVDWTKRITSDELVKKLERMHRRCSEDAAYAKPEPRPAKPEPEPRTASRSRASGRLSRSISVSVNMVRVPNTNNTWPREIQQQESYNIDPGLGGSSSTRSSTVPAPFSCYTSFDFQQVECDPAQGFGMGLSPVHLQPPNIGGLSSVPSSTRGASPTPQSRKRQRSGASVKEGQGKRRKAATRSPSATREPSEPRDAEPSSKILFACPYFKHDPITYGTKEWNSCSGPGWEIPRLKEHLNRKHYHPGFRCNRCLLWHTTQEKLDEHQRSEFQCLIQPRHLDETIDSVQWGMIQERKRKVPCLTKWEDLYKIIFPRTPQDSIPSPFRDEPFAEFRDYLNSQLRCQPNPQRLSDIEATFRMIVEFQNSRSVTHSSTSSYAPSLTNGYSNATTKMYESPTTMAESSPILEGDMGALPFGTYLAAPGEHGGMAGLLPYGSAGSQLAGMSNDPVPCWFSQPFMGQTDMTGNDQIGIPPGEVPSLRFGFFDPKYGQR